jgi:hypothetical protein
MVFSAVVPLAPTETNAATGDDASLLNVKLPFVVKVAAVLTTVEPLGVTVADVFEDVPVPVT